MVKVLKSYRKYEVGQGGHAMIFRGKPGSGKKTVANWMVQASGSNKIVVDAKDVRDRKVWLDELYEQADLLARQTNKPTVIIFKNTEVLGWHKDVFQGMRITLMTLCAFLDKYQRNHYVVSVFLFDDWKEEPAWRCGDFHNRCVRVYFQPLQEKYRLEFLNEYLPKNHHISQAGIELAASWSSTFNAGDLKNLIERATHEAILTGQDLQSKHLLKELGKMLWEKHVFPQRRKIIAVVGIGTLGLVYVLTRKYHQLAFDEIKSIFESMKR